MTARISRPIHAEPEPQPVQDARPEDDENDDTPGEAVLPLPAKPPAPTYAGQVTRLRKPRQQSLF